MSISSTESFESQTANYTALKHCAVWVDVALVVGACALLVFGFFAYFQVGALAQLPYSAYFAYPSWAISAMALVSLAVGNSIVYSVKGCASDRADLAKFYYSAATKEHITYRSNLGDNSSNPILFYRKSSTLKQLRRELLKDGRSRYQNIPDDATYEDVDITLFIIRSCKYQRVDLKNNYDDNTPVSELAALYPDCWSSLGSISVTFPTAS